MKKTLFYILSLTVLITCTNDAFEEEGEPPVVLFELVVSTGEGGSVNTSGGSYESGSSVTITATPESEYLFVGWTGTESTDNPLTITVNSNQEISPIFEKKKYQLSVNVTGEGTVTEEVVSTGKTTDYDSGTVVKLTAVPTDGHAFFNWTNESALDTINPIQITVDGNKSIDVNFDYQTARDLVGEWEFELQDEVTAKSHGRILMRIDIRLNILFTLILNNTTTQIFSRLTTLSSTTMVMGGFGAFTNVNFKTTSSSSLSFNLITFPPSTPPPTSVNNIPPPTPSNSLTLTGNKTSNNTAPIVPPPTATTSATAPTQTTSNTNALAGVVSQVNAAVNPITCSISGTLTSGPQSQTVTASTAITNVVYSLSSNCTDTLSASASGLPSGVSLSFSNNTATISGSPSANSSGTFDYLINAVNSSGTASASFNGSIIVVPQAAVVTSTTVTPCEITGSLTSGPQTQTVTATSAITNVIYTFSTTCTDTLTANASGLPAGVSMSFSNNIATISGTPSANATGTFSYSLTAVNAAATASSTFDGTIVVIPVPTATATTTTTSTSIYFENGTCKCPNANIGDTATISGTLYTVVDNSTIADQIANGNVNLCTSLVTKMSNLFKDNTSFNDDISFWDTQNVTEMSSMFWKAENFNIDISSWNTSNVTTMISMFYKASSFNQNIGSWITSSVSNMSDMFHGAYLFNQDISNWDTQNVISFRTMFHGGGNAHQFNQEIGGWNTSKSNDMGYMFSNATSFNKNIGNWDVSNVTDMDEMFRNASSFNQDISSWCVNNITSEPSSFSSNSALTNTNKPVWGTCPTVSCTISGTLTSANGSNSQTVSMSTAITNIEYTLTTTCSDTLSAAIAWTPSAPNGVSMSFSNNVVTISGTPTGTATGTYNYTLTASNTAGTASASFSGSLTVTSTNSLRTYIPDNNFEQALIDLGYDDVMDDYVLTANISVLTGQLSLYQKNISDLTGIEDFDNISNLYIVDNDLSSIDLSGIPQLTELYASNNDITSVNFDSNVNLEVIDLSRNNNLSSIDLSNNLELKSFSCASCDISSIDISNNTKLTSLGLGSLGYADCNGSFCYNSLTSIDLSSNPNIKSLGLDGNNISNLNISNLTQLESLNVQNVPLNSIDLSSTVSMTNLNVNGTNITSLDVSNQNVLRVLNCVSTDQLSCIKVSQLQLDNQVSNGTINGAVPQPLGVFWSKDDSDQYSLVCGSCTISGTLTSAVGSDSQTVSMSTAITSIEYTLTTTCSDTLSAAIAWTPSTPNGVSMSFSNNVVTISGTPTGTATVTYNYTLTASNTAGTASATFSGSLNVSSSTSSGVIGGIGVTGSTFEVTTFKSNVGTDYQMASRDGYLYTQSSNSTIIKIDVSTGSSTIIATSFVNGCSGNGYSGLECRLTSDGIAVDSNGYVYVHPLDVNLNPSQSIIKRIIPSTSSTPSVTAFAGGDQGYADGNGTSAKFQWSKSIIFDANDNMYTVDSDRIRKITPNGDVTTYVEDTNNENFDDIAFDSKGNLFISTQSTSRILKYVPSSGSLTVFAGVGDGYNDGDGTTQAKFYKPAKIAIDSNDNIYVADNYCRIRKITSQGYVTTIAGPTSQLNNGMSDCGYTDGYGNNARFSWMGSTSVSLAIDNNDNLYVGERDNNRIRKINLN